MFGLAVGALGIVYGDIGTSPLYALREAFEHNDLAVNSTSTYGVASIVFWALVVIISIKYLALVMRADNHGEGGILALTALLIPRRAQGSPSWRADRLTGVAAAGITLGVFGTALLYGDGLITPAISVLSAVEGFEVATSCLRRLGAAGLGGDPRRPVQRAVPRHGRHRQGVRTGDGRVVRRARRARVAPGDRPPRACCKAVWPGYAVEFFVDQPGKAFLSLGSIFLVVTGGEALYADMGHFGRRPIQLSWYTWVFPALVLNYFGQAALLTAEPDAIESPFYRLAPDWAVTPLAILATMATVIASQALISGAFSMTAQAIQLDYIPRLAVRHTSGEHAGQIYVPLVNWLLMLGCVGLVLGFRSSSALASAYGIAVTATMAITTLLFFKVVQIPLRMVANEGDDRPPSAARRRPRLLRRQRPEDPPRRLVPVADRRRARDPDDDVAPRPRPRRRPAAPRRGADDRDDGQPRPRRHACAGHRGVPVQGPRGDTPGAARQRQAPHGAPREPAAARHSSQRGGLRRRVARSPCRTSVPACTRSCCATDSCRSPTCAAAVASVEVAGQPVDPEAVTYFLGDEMVIATDIEGMHPWREHLFVLLDRGADSASRFFDLPADRVVTVGTHVEI